MEELIANLEASAPPFNDQVTVSLAVNVWTAVVFSFIDLEKVVLPDSPASIILETDTATVWSAALVKASVALTITT